MSKISRTSLYLKDQQTQHEAKDISTLAAMGIRKLEDYAKINSIVATPSSTPTTDDTSMISAVPAITKNQAFAEKNQACTDRAVCQLASIFLMLQPPLMIILMTMMI